MPASHTFVREGGQDLSLPVLEAVKHDLQRLLLIEIGPALPSMLPPLQPKSLAGVESIISLTFFYDPDDM